MSLSVNYTNLQVKKQCSNLSYEEELIAVRDQLQNDVCWGSGKSDYKAIKLLNGNACWERFRPSIELLSENNPQNFKLTFCDDFFNLEAEGVNHFIGTIAGDVLINNRISDILVDDFSVSEYERRYFPGPTFGIDGVYQLFNLSNDRPLLAFSVKPRMGYDKELFEAILNEAAEGGADIIEDDERLIDPTYCRFGDRIEIASKVQQKHPGSFYSANITGPFDKMKERVDAAANKGIRFVKLDVLVTGFDSLRDIAWYIRNKCYDIRITVYPDVIGKYRNLSRRFICKMARMCGTDVLYAGSPRWSRDIIYGNSLIYECEKVNMRHQMLKSQEGDLQGFKTTLATMTNDISAQSAEILTYIFKNCFSQSQFAFFIGHGISCMDKSVHEAVEGIHKRISKAASADKKQEYSIEPIENKGVTHGNISEDYSNYDLTALVRKYKRGY